MNETSSETMNETLSETMNETSSETMNLSLHKELEKNKVVFHVELAYFEKNKILYLLQNLYTLKPAFKEIMDKNETLTITKGIHFDRNNKLNSKHFTGYFEETHLKYHFYIYKNMITGITSINNLLSFHQR
jgi:hypothetical protein